MVTEALTDLAAHRLGGLVVAASDEFFAPKERLLEPSSPRFDSDQYTIRGKLMDGWETRRHSPEGRDWALVRLGAPGVVREAVVDTTHFRGNAPARCALHGCVLDGHHAIAELAAARWEELLAPVALEPDRVNRFQVPAELRVTHVRLTIIPDGGVARLRLLGEVVTDLRSAVDRHDTLDLASVLNGGQVVAASEEFFSPAQNLVQVGDARDMSDGWETRRHGQDQWVVIRLATTGFVDRIEVDTTHFLGNHPEHCSIEVGDSPGRTPGTDATWHEVVPQTPLGPHARHVFDVADPVSATHVRLNIHPDGGVARLRAYGRIIADGWRRAGTRWLNALGAVQAEEALTFCCGSRRWAARMAERRPFGSFDAFATAADAVWRELDAEDWLEAFAAHPRIGDRSGPAHTRREQAGTAAADPGTLAALAEGNREYERRFGHVFLIAAAGKTAAEMLAALRDRLGNDPQTELMVAAEQQRQITRLRLDTMMRPTRERT